MLKVVFKSLAGAVVLLGLAVAAVLAVVLSRGVSTRTPPLAIEETAARAVRHLAVPSADRERANPLVVSGDVLADARAHWADHCASCHANDGSGAIAMGQNMFPPAPDMRDPKTQDLSDGELYWIIRNGIRFTGMPAWGPPTGEDEESWALVHFIRTLPELTSEDLAAMEEMNPTLSRLDVEEELEIQRFLAGG